MLRCKQEMIFIKEENFTIFILKSITNVFKDPNFVKELVDMLALILQFAKKNDNFYLPTK
jgi:hypothetical protein